MGNKRQRLPAYDSVIGEATEIVGEIRFFGALHVDGKVVGDVSGQSPDGCALTLGQSGTIEGNIDVAHVVLDGTVIGDVRAAHRAELAAGARIEGKLYYGVLEMAEGAALNGKLLHMDESQTPQLVYQGQEMEGIGGAAKPAETASDTPTGDSIYENTGVPRGHGST